MRWGLGFLVGLAATMVLLAWGCGGDGDGVSCGPGTVRVGDTCVADESGGGSTMGGDASVGDPGGGGGSGGAPPGGGGSGGGGSTVADAGGFSTEPPVDGGGGGGFAGPAGCDSAAGECDTWETGILDGLRTRQAAAGCADMLVEDARVDAVAERHATHQATVDRLDSSSPDGDLFMQVADEGVRFMDAAAAFSVTRLGAEDVLSRWDANPSVAPLLRRCGYMTGVGFETGASGASYATLLMVKL
jgi:hypothetical protein